MTAPLTLRLRPPRCTTLRKNKSLKKAIHSEGVNKRRKSDPGADGGPAAAHAMVPPRRVGSRPTRRLRRKEISWALTSTTSRRKELKRGGEDVRQASSSPCRRRPSRRSAGTTSASPWRPMMRRGRSMQNAQQEEFKHFAMDLEFLLSPRRSGRPQKRWCSSPRATSSSSAIGGRGGRRRGARNLTGCEKTRVVGRRASRAPGRASGVDDAVLSLTAR